MSCRTRLCNAIFKDAPVPTAVLDSDGKIKQSNKSFQELLGFSESELRCQDWRKLINPQDASGVRDEITKSQVSGDSFVLKVRFIAKDGVQIWTRMHVTPLSSSSQKLLTDVVELVTWTLPLRVPDDQKFIIKEAANGSKKMVPDVNVKDVLLSTFWKNPRLSIVGVLIFILLVGYLSDGSKEISLFLLRSLLGLPTVPESP